MKTSMMKRNWLTLVCVFLLTGGLSTVALAAKPVDNDGDGWKSNKDCNDNDPAINPGATEICIGGVDENCDTFIDCNDPTCSGDPVCQTPTEICDDGADNDGDTLIDCADHSDCDGQPGGPGGELCAADETGLCNDGFDNDADGLTDNNDPDCQGAQEICDNGLDDDSDGLTDCEDHVDCNGQPGGPGGELCAQNETGFCNDGFDNDADGFTDGNDTDCQQPEICNNGSDDDADGLTDCEDHADCDGQLGGPMGQLCSGNEVGYCTDGFDNDADGFTDGADPDCQGGAEVCDDGIDNDVDGLIDCADPDCGGIPACSGGNRLSANRVTGTVLGIGPDDGLWNATAATTYSMAWRDDIADTCPPNNNCSGQQPTLTVKAIHNGTDIAFLMTWNDTSPSSDVYEPKDFGDRAVIMLNANRICQMGSPTNPTNMWFWNAADKTQAGGYGSVQNLLGGGIGTVTHTDGDDNIQVVSNHTGSEWQVVMSRPLAAIDPADQFEFTLGVTTEVAFALYDGAFKQRNGAKWISGRESMDIAP